uniref:Uncharacterized protein n=1 Tax=Compsopogon caeruleus TaxID=31354 RepID=A0A7S1T5S8_9RHOD|mmetsp:Transcript_11252/g.22638  ORF Transcript_11252/g.22638 Transcript_11252/m.22638 type:complete len:112 (+) Transcript_11252:317-652(+)|eukprot:CAMPEP_0184682756 /NCGR_PEP_ID=MMETSP0312-20130426/8624_1 /TAXON_ID=31354 /ORGANISM="Compsopogon coeruleus, Strain SAG 36.94" /LENGTH=111 /DNA_ID=CAMNT_0027134635 /DNA_START=302 /DNA_END=637 /DNA_ORIENTATION=+
MGRGRVRKIGYKLRRKSWDREAEVMDKYRASLRKRVRDLESQNLELLGFTSMLDATLREVQLYLRKQHSQELFVAKKSGNEDKIPCFSWEKISETPREESSLSARSEICSR